MAESPTVMDTQTVCQNDTTSTCRGQNHWTDGQNDTASSSGQNQQTDSQNDTSSSSGQNQQTDSQNDTASSSGQNQRTDGQNDIASSSGQNQQTDSQNDIASSIGQNQRTDGQNDTVSSSGQNQRTDGQNDTASFSGQNQLTDGRNDTASSSGQNQLTDGQNDTASSSGQTQQTDGQNDTASSSGQTQQTDGQNDTASSSGQTQQTASQNATSSSSGQTKQTDGQNDTASSSGQTQQTDGQNDTASSSGQTQQTDGQNDIASSSGQNQRTDGQNDTASSSGQNQQTDSQNDTASSSGQNQQTDSQNDIASSSGQNQRTDGQNDTASSSGQNQRTDGQNNTATSTSSGQNQLTDGQNNTASSSGQNQQTDSQNDTSSSSGQTQQTDSQNDTATSASSGQNQQTDSQNDTATSSGQNHQTAGQNDTASSSGQNHWTAGQNDTASSSGQNHWTAGQNDTASSSGQNHQTDVQYDTTTSSGQNQQIFLNSFQTKATFCLNHIDKYVSLFCRTCDRLLCASCIIDGNHSNHSFCEMDHVAKEKQLQLREVVSNRGKEICEHVQNSIIVMKQEKGSVTEMCKTVSEEIAKQKTTLIQKIERWNEDLQTMLRDYQTVKVGCLSDRMVQADTCLTLLKVFLENPDSIDAFEKRKSIQILEIVHDISNPLKGLKVNPLSFLPGSGLCERELHTLFGSLAGVSCETSASDNTEDIIPQGNSVCVDTGETVDSDQDSTDTESLYEDVVGSETMYKCAKSPIDRIAPVDINSSFIVTKNKLYLVDFSKHKGDIEKEEPLMTGVVHITPVTEKGIYVQQEGIQSQVVTRVTTTGKLYRFLDCGSETLKCVGVSNSGQVIICTEKIVIKYNGRHKEGRMIIDFSIYNQNGTYNKSILETRWYNTIDIVMTMSALYILNSTLSIPDKRFKSGTVNDLLGDFKYYRGVIGKDPASQFHPRGMCQDKDGRLVVTDYWNHAVHLLTPEVEFSKFLMREEDGLAYPTAVAMDNYRHLWIGQCDGTIHIIKYIP